MNFRNKYESSCCDCGGWIPVGDGFLLGKDQATGRWFVACMGCFFGTTQAEPPRDTPPPPRPIVVPACLQVLGLRPPVDREVVKRQFRQLAMVRHPDRGGDARGFIEIEHAYREALMLAGGGRP